MVLWSKLLVADVILPVHRTIVSVGVFSVVKFNSGVGAGFAVTINSTQAE